MLQDVQTSAVVKQRTRNKLLLFLGLIVVIFTSFAYLFLTNLNSSTSSLLPTNIKSLSVGFLEKIRYPYYSQISTINIANQNPSLHEISLNETSIKIDKIRELINNININRPNSAKIKTVSAVFSESPLKNNFTWNNNGQVETFKGYEIDTSIDGSVVVYIYLNMGIYNSHNWDERSIRAEAEKLVYLSLLSVDNQGEDTESLVKKSNEIFENLTKDENDLLFVLN